MRWPFSRPPAAPEPAPPWPPRMAHPGTEDPVAAAVQFVCSTCGRTDLPEAGGWDPPICLECDAAINEDADEAAEYLGH